MDVRQLRHFRAVAETLHFGRAARQLNMTQPPLSQSIMALERELGAQLFLRDNRNVALTPFGEQWLVSVSAALAAVDALPEAARRLRDGEVGRLRLSFVSTADYSVLPNLVRRFSTLYPDVEIGLSEATSDVQIASLLRGEGQVGIIIPPATGTLPDPLVYRRLMSEPLVAAVPESWIEDGRLAPIQDDLSPEALSGLPLIIFPKRVAPTLFDLVTGYFAARARPARIVQEAIQMQTIISLVSAGLGMALVPASLRHLARTGVRYVDLRGGGPLLESGIAWRDGDATPTLLRFLAVAAELHGGT